MTLSIQFITMAAMVLSGIYLGFIRDTFQRFAIYWKGKKLLSYLLEIIFWILQALIVFYVLFRVNAGEIRLYIILACLLGFSAYQALMKTIYKRVLERIIFFGTRIFHIFERIIAVLFITPLKWLFIICTAIVMFVLRMIFSVVIYIIKLLFFPFHLLGKAIYPIIPENFFRFSHKFVRFYSTIRNILKKWLKYMTFRRR